jgi:hypothetical protein
MRPEKDVHRTVRVFLEALRVDDTSAFSFSFLNTLRVSMS